MNTTEAVTVFVSWVVSIFVGMTLILGIKAEINELRTEFSKHLVREHGYIPFIVPERK